MSLSGVIAFLRNPLSAARFSGGARSLAASWRRLGLAVLSLLAVSTMPAGAEPVPLRVQLLWHHQAQFAGMYVAEAKGFYERAGLKVELVAGGPGIDPLDNLGRRRVDIAMGWLPAAVHARLRGWDIVNIGQVFADAGTAIVCRRDAGIGRIEDIAGKTVGVWYMGDEINLAHWLQTIGLSMSDIRPTAQFPDARDLINGRVDCATAMMYNEYWSILDSHVSPGDLIVIRLADEGLGFLEDGFYARREILGDPQMRAAAAAFVRATMEGWDYARRNVDEAFAITMARAPGVAPAHQQRMLNSVLSLVGAEGKTGLLDIGAYERSIGMLASQQGEELIRRLAQGAWTHRLWYESGLGADSLLTVTSATRHHLDSTVASAWFTALLLVGSAVFGFAGFMRARQRGFDLWGAFVMTLLPAAGGGTIRDLLVGGDRYPPFIVQDPVYLYVIMGTFVFGVASTAVITEKMVASRPFDWTMKALDTLGFAAVVVVGAKVALVAQLSWIWIPICCGLTAAGGGMLSDIVTGREPRTFRGEPYEELAVVGGLFMLMGLQIADTYEHVTWIAPAVIVATLVLLVAMRGTVIVLGIKFRTFGPPPAALEPEERPALATPAEPQSLAELPAPSAPAGGRRVQ